MSTNEGSHRRVSRRKFLRNAAAGAGATAAGLGRRATAEAQGAGANASASTAGVQIPSAFAAAKTAAPTEMKFPLTGAQVFAQACKEQGVGALFCCPGNYSLIHAIAATGIPAYGGRHEGSMAHAADAFIASTGEIAVCSGTEGPGFTNMISAIAAANAKRTPLLLIASNMAMANEDTESGIQLMYQQPTTQD
jgi:hypothetical protein